MFDMSPMESVVNRRDLRCEHIPASGPYSGDRCPKPSRFLVVNSRTASGVRVCGRHIGQAIEDMAQPGAREVIVSPDFYTEYA